MASVASRVPDAIGIISGEGKEKGGLGAQREALGLADTLHLVGYWPDLAEALCALDVFVLPSLMEGHPLAVLEAMAAAKPVVATAGGGTREAGEPGVPGFPLPPAPPPPLAPALPEMLLCPTPPT